MSSSANEVFMTVRRSTLTLKVANMAPLAVCSSATADGKLVYVADLPASKVALVATGGSSRLSVSRHAQCCESVYSIIVLNKSLLVTSCTALSQSSIYCCICDFTSFSYQVCLYFWVAWLQSLVWWPPV
jgi:hypothetical protein